MFVSSFEATRGHWHLWWWNLSGFATLNMPCIAPPQLERADTEVQTLKQSQ